MTIKEEVTNLLATFPRSSEDELNNGASEEEIEKFSRNVISIPPELKDWLNTCNAPLIGSGGIFLGLQPAPKSRLIEWHYQLHPFWIGKKWIPIASDGCGNYYILDANKDSSNKQPVYFIDHEQGYDEPCYIVASGLWTFLRFVIVQEQTKDRRFPFDKNYVLEKDPDLMMYAGNVHLPWET